MLENVSINIIDVKRPFLKKLNPEDNLSKIRKVLSCDNTILFLRRKDGEIIEYEDERNFPLEEIYTTDVRNEKSIYLKKTTYWDILKEDHKLGYGRTITISDKGTKVATKRAFEIEKFSELKEFDRHEKGTIEINSTEELIKSKNLFFNANINIQDLITLELSGNMTQDETFRDGRKLIYNFTQVGKCLLKLCKGNLNPTTEFINAIKSIIKSEDPSEEFKKVIEDYGLFIPTEIIMGGKFYSNDTEMSSEHVIKDTKEGQIIGHTDTLDIGIGGSHDASKDETAVHRATYMKTLGGNVEGVFDEGQWTESLKNFHNWDCIEFNNPISIFQLLPDDLHHELYKIVGKKILYTGNLTFEYYLYRPGSYRKIIVKDEQLSSIIQNEDADCDIFAEVVDTGQESKNVIFTCQICKPEGGFVKPSIIIHGIQKELKEFHPRKYNLKIILMVVGYDVDFKFAPSSSTSIELIREEYNPEVQNDSKFGSIILKTKCELKGTNYPFIGISVLNSLDSPNDSLVIGHNYHEVQSEHELKVDIFSYCSRENRYCNIPRFTFCTLIILDASSYHSCYLKFNKLKKPFIDLNENENKTNPKYVSFLLNDDDHRPIFFIQKAKRINVEYVCCKCETSNCICHKKTKKIEKDNSTCILFDPINQSKSESFKEDKPSV